MLEGTALGLSNHFSGQISLFGEANSCAPNNAGIQLASECADSFCFFCFPIFVVFVVIINHMVTCVNLTFFRAAVAIASHLKAFEGFALGSWLSSDSDGH